MQAINLDTYNLSLLTAKEDILNPRSSTNWALFTYDGATNNLKLADSGAGGVEELAQKFHIARPLYGLCRLGSVDSGQPLIIMICWVGENVDECRRVECASHIPAIKTFFKEAHVFVNAERPEDVTEEKITAIAGKVQTPSDRVKKSARPAGKEEMVGTNYRKTNAAMEMRRINRDSFWARAEREEEERKEEERKRAAEERRRVERERVQQECREAEERERKMNEKLQLIEEQRRMQAQLEAEVRKKEKSRWEQQEREHEEDMRTRFRRSESIEKAAEAAALISQRSMNPREFFRQLSSSSSRSPSSPFSPRTGKPPSRRYQRSLTDTAFTFGASDSPVPTSPTWVSPFTRTSNSHIHGPMSPPISSFQPIPSPRPCVPLAAPPSLPQRTSPPASALPALPSSSPVRSLSPEPTIIQSPGLLQCSALPVSPALLDNRAQSPPTSSLSDSSSPQQASTSSPLEELLQPDKQYTATHLLTDLEPEDDFIVTAVLVEEEKEEEEEERAEEEEEERAEEEDEERAEEGDEERAEEEDEERAEEGDEERAEEEDEEEDEMKTFVERVATENRTAGASTLFPECELPVSERKAENPGGSFSPEESEEETAPPTEMESVAQQEPEADQYGQEIGDECPLLDPVEVSEEEWDVTENSLDERVALQPIPGEADIPSTNGVTDEELVEECEDTVEHNGTERSTSPFQMDQSNPESDLYLKKSDWIEQELITEIQEEKSENRETPVNTQYCVRALYEYQAEDESELSLEPGDIITAVEPVDKAWWRGCTMDGRQGLFPANYVENI